MENLVMIDVDRIYPHENNPRKELGDLTELVSSIKENGIFQNLTVVPKGEDYTVIIGHRRLAASKEAGLLKVPCAIVEMDEKEQIATMLLENMQRSDLTVYEQTAGIQMMLDLGETIDSVAEKTGLSVSTVRRRAKIAQLDMDEVKQSVARGATLTDFIELEKLKDPTVKNKVLKSIGTANFNMELSRALREEQWEEAKNNITEVLNTFAEPVKQQPPKSKWITQYSEYNYKKGEVKVPEDIDTRKYFYKLDDYYKSIILYGEHIVTDEEAEKQRKAEEERAENRRRTERLDALAEDAYRVRFNFILNFGKDVSKFKEIGKFAAKQIFEYGYNYNRDIMLEAAKQKGYSGENIGKTDFIELYKDEIEYCLLICTYSCMNDKSSETYHFSYNGEYSGNDDLDEIYDFLQELGFEMSDVEKALKDGTHELYLKEDEEDEV